MKRARMLASTLDRWTLAYALLVSGVLAFRWPVQTPLARLLLLAHLLLFALIAIAPIARRNGAVGRFLGEWYPLILVPAFYAEVGVLNRSAGRSFDALVLGWEQALFGMQPSYDWIRAQPWPWLSIPLHVGYLSYYAIVAGAPLVIWLQGRHEEAKRILLYTAATFFICFTVFLLFPVAGPRYRFPIARNAATAVAPAVFTQRLLDRGSAWGTAFPSSHVAATMVASVLSWRAWRILGYIFIPLALMLTVGTVYGQLHYAIDAIAGLALASVALAVALRRRPSSDARLNA